MSTINFERLDAAITYGFEHPEEFSMDSWFERTPCGTTGCLAGTAIQQAGWKPRFYGACSTTDVAVNGDQERMVRRLAAELLGLDGYQAGLIFYQSDLLAVIQIRNRWAREAGVPQRTWVPKLPCELQCPKCTHRQWCSEEDPDAGFSEMWKHVYWLHALTEGRETSAAHTLTGRLMTQVAVIPCV